MTMVEAMSRMGQIQATLIQMSSARTAPAAASAAPVATSAGPVTDATSAAAFAQAMTSTAAVAPATGIDVSATGATGPGVVAAAEKYLGVPYVFGGESRSGMDCSGLVQRVFADLGVKVPRLVSGQMKIGTPVASLADAKPGDLIIPKGAGHIVIYAGGGKIIHAPYPGRTVCLRDNYLRDSDIETIRRVVPSSAAATASTAASSRDMLSAALASLVKDGPQ